MGDDDDADCVEHIWQLAGAVLAPGGAQSKYVCLRYDSPLVVDPDDIPPGTI